jgi:chorismate synthase
MNSFGNLFKITIYGESHQKAIGVIIDGMPSGILVDEVLIASDLKRRNPDLIGTTPRKEADHFSITSGVFNGYTTGSPIHVMIENTNVQSKDYENLKEQPRPGHADFAARSKYNNFHDYRGGGRFSGRLTAPITIAGSFAKMMLPFTFEHTLKQIGTLKDLSQIDAYLNDIAKKGDSVGGVIEVKVQNIPVGLGEPMFEKLDAKIAQMMFSIPAVKGVSIGTGFEGINMTGSEFNDQIIDAQGHTKTNHSGGITGGISNGNDLVVSVFIKPTSSIKQKQETYDFKTGSVQSLEIEGRHDVAIVRRAGIVLENAIAIVLADFYLIHKAYQ